MWRITMAIGRLTTHERQFQIRDVNHPDNTILNYGRHWRSPYFGTLDGPHGVTMARLVPMNLRKSPNGLYCKANAEC